MKIVGGLAILKEISLKLETNGQEMSRYYGYYYKQIVRLVYQFKFYSYYILREYELSLKNINKLLEMLAKEETKLDKVHPSQTLFF